MNAEPARSGCGPRLAHGSRPQLSPHRVHPEKSPCHRSSRGGEHSSVFEHLLPSSSDSFSWSSAWAERDQIMLPIGLVVGLAGFAMFIGGTCVRFDWI